MEGGTRRSVRWPGRTLLSWIALSALAAVAAQENAGMTIPTSLVDCYSNVSLLTHAALPAFGIGQFIDLVRKVENNRYTSLDLKSMAVQLTHRFRQDGIRRAPDVTASDGVVPFTPSGPEFFRHMILLTKLIPGNAYNFPNNSLTTAEQCALHFMMSSTVDDINRGSNDDQPCSNLKNYASDPYGNSATMGGYQSGGYGGYSGYGGGKNSGYGGGGYSSGVNYNSRRAQPTRGPRRTRDASPGIEDDVEILDPSLQAEVSEKAGKSTNYVRSRCPQQSGVVLTPWGTVSMGTVVAAIAAGLMPQTVQGDMLAAAFPRSRYYTPRRSGADTMGAIDNRWAATFSGDLAQVALLQGAGDRSNMAVGLAGGWSSAFEPKQFYITPANLNRQTDGSMTDPMVRGSIDGLIMASYVTEWYSRTSNSLKLSQLLDMYYSERGVFDRNTRACSRRERFGDVATTQTMNSQTEAFSKFYSRNNPLSVSMTDDVISDLADAAVSKLQTYIPSTLSNPACEVASTVLLTRPYVDLVLLLDTTWQYTDIHPAISYLLDNTDAGQYGSRVVVLNANDGSMLFNSTYPRLDWHVAYTSDAHSAAAVSSSGFDMLTSLGAAMQYLRARDAERYDRRVLGGRGQAVLFVPQQSKGVDQNSLWSRMMNYRLLYPDVDLMVLASRNINRNAFSALTNDTNNNVFSLEPSDPYQAMSQLVKRLKTVPRRLRNPNCDPDWEEDRQGNTELVDYVEPLGVNYYRLAPNNFFRTTSEYARLRVTTVQGYGTLTVCYARTMPSPNGTASTMASQAASAGTCAQVGNNGLEIPIRNLCDNAYFVSDCAPLFLAVSAAQASTGSSARCQDQDACRFPDMLKYSISLENGGCWSSAAGLQALGVLATLLVALSSRLLQ